MIGTIGSGLLQFLAQIIELYQMVIFVAVMLTWVNPDPYNQIVRFVTQITDPVLKPARKMFWQITQRIGVDLSPILVILGLQIVSTVLRQVAYNLRY